MNVFTRYTKKKFAFNYGRSGMPDFNSNVRRFISNTLLGQGFILAKIDLRINATKN